MRIDFKDGVLTLSLEEGETSFKVMQDEGIMRISPNSEQETRKKDPKPLPAVDKKISSENLRTASQVANDEFGDSVWGKEDEKRLVSAVRTETLSLLHELQKVAGFRPTKGIAQCNHCNSKHLPSTGYFVYEGWEWPSDLEHMVSKHNLFPSEDFMDFLESFRRKCKRAKSTSRRKK